MIKETNQLIGLEFYAHVAFLPFKDYMSYVRGKVVDYIPLKINSLLHLRPTSRYSIQNIRV